MFIYDKIIEEGEYMVSMSKEEMIQYIDDYVCVLDILVHNPNMSIGEAFSSHMYSNNRLFDNTIE